MSPVILNGQPPEPAPAPPPADNDQQFQLKWPEAELSAIAKQELAPYLDEHDARVRMDGLETVL